MEHSEPLFVQPDAGYDQTHLSRRSFLNAFASAALACPLFPMGFPEQTERGHGTATPMVPTMSGPVPPAKLGTMLIHEHVLWGPIPDEVRDQSVEIAVKYLNEASRVGIDSLACLSPDRDMDLYARIAARSPVKIVVSTGAYLYSRSRPAIQQMNEEQMFERIVRETTEGIDSTSIRAGIIKAASARSLLTAWEKASFRAAGRAQALTGVPVATHAVFGAREQFDILLRAGADPRRCFFSHPENTVGWEKRNLQEHSDYLTAIAKEGGYLLFNNFGLVKHTAWTDLVQMIRQLCDSGCADRVLISVDLAWEWIAGNSVIQHADRYPELQPRTYSFMMTDIVPALLKAGFSQQDIRTFLVDNPRRFFGGNP